MSNLLSQSIWAAVTGYCRLAGLQTTEIDFFQFWKREAQDQGTSRCGVWFVDGCLCTVSSQDQMDEGAPWVLLHKNIYLVQTAEP